MKKISLLLLTVLMAVLFLAACNSSEASEDYPEGTIEILIPYSAGGQTDISARVFAEHIQKYLDTDVVIINQTGGSGAVALNEVASDDSEGYKFLLHHDAMHTGYAVGQLEQTFEDLTPLDVSAAVNQAFVVHADSPWDNLTEFVEDSQANPGEYVYAADIGGTTHFMGGMLTQATDIDLKMQDVGGEAERMAALLGGHADIAVTSVSNAVDYVESGDYKVLAVLTEERDELAPDFPTAIEQGFDITFSVTNVLYGPPELPEGIIEIWDEATEELVADEEYQQAISDVNMVHDKALNQEETEKHVKESFDYIQGLGEDLGY